ncbi:MAG: four helix bundle protein [Kiritimatiellia bacterium]|jgi:four helix bundle protein|nr:four helix bundle protein [Lentisphaerota bacterium]
MKTDGVLQTKSKAFAIRIVRLFQFLTEKKREFVLSKQVLRSGTSIGANIAESKYAISRKDFILKLQIALKEASETAFWLELLHETDYLAHRDFSGIYADCEEMLRLLTSSLLTLKKQSPA